MKIPYKSGFNVYDPALAEILQNHPAIIKGRARRGGARKTAAIAAIKNRKEKCVDTLLTKSQRHDLHNLYCSLVDSLWSPITERDLVTADLYAQLPATLWDALSPTDSGCADAQLVISDIIWAMIKERTWHVNEYGERDEPLVWRIWDEDLTIEKNKQVFEQVFAAGIRHTFFNNSDGSKYDRRLLALATLQRLSTRTWGTDS
jgi:hypothetical protein